MATDAKKIILGSGKLYLKLFTEYITDVKAIITELKDDENLLGLISGGASLEYKPDFTTVEDDLALMSKTVLTKEEVTLKSGVMTWNGRTLESLCATARCNEDRPNGLRITKIGGIGNQNRKMYVLLFVYEDDQDGNSYVIIVGNCQAGFTIAFDKDKATVIDAEFLAKPLDSDGTKVIYAEEIPTTALGALTVTSVAGSVTGKTKITVTQALTGSDTYMYKTATTVSLPGVGDVCDTTAGYTAWDGTSDISATTGNEIVIVEVDSSKKAVNAGKATVTAKA